MYLYMFELVLIITLTYLQSYKNQKISIQDVVEKKETSSICFFFLFVCLSFKIF